MIKLNKVTFQYETQSPTLNGIDLAIDKGSFVVIVGASGSGKTTLLKLIANLITPTSGDISINGKVAMVFQSGALLPWQSVAGNVVLPLIVNGKSQEVADKETVTALSRVGLSLLADKYPREISGGQRQRVGIARALAIKPDILILDEPFSALDIQTVTELHIDLLKIWKELGLTVVMVSHSIEEAVTLAERVLVVKNGTISRDIAVPFSYPRNLLPTPESIALQKQIVDSL